MCVFFTHPQKRSYSTWQQPQGKLGKQLAVLSWQQLQQLSLKNQNSETDRPGPFEFSARCVSAFCFCRFLSNIFLCKLRLRIVAVVRSWSTSILLSRENWHHVLSIQKVGGGGRGSTPIRRQQKLWSSSFTVQGRRRWNSKLSCYSPGLHKPTKRLVSRSASTDLLEQGKQEQTPVLEQPGGQHSLHSSTQWYSTASTSWSGTLNNNKFPVQCSKIWSVQYNISNYWWHIHCTKSVDLLV